MASITSATLGVPVGAVEARPSITQMVSHLKTSITMLEERIQGNGNSRIEPIYELPHSPQNGSRLNSRPGSATGSLNAAPRASRSGGSHYGPHAAHESSNSSTRPYQSGEAPPRPEAQRSHSSVHGELTSNIGLPASLGRAMASAVTRALGANRFNVVRDSVNGEQMDETMHPPPRPMASSRNTLTVRLCCLI
jgi:hypothetical protein